MRIVVVKVGDTLDKDRRNIGVGKQAEAPEHIPTRVSIMLSGDGVTTVAHPSRGTWSGCVGPRWGAW